jgi:hypothetical protein
MEFPDQSVNLPLVLSELSHFLAVKRTGPNPVINLVMLPLFTIHQVVIVVNTSSMDR